MNNYRRVSRGILLAALASGSWGISGTVLQLISQNLAIPAPWMLSMRTFSAGVLLLAISLVLYGKKTFAIFADKRSALSVITYAIFGLMANLLTFYYAIQTGNASIYGSFGYLNNEGFAYNSERLDGDDFTIPGAPLYCVGQRG